MLCEEHGLTDAHQAERFAATYGDDLRYDHQRSSWFVYRDHVWKQDRDGEAKRLAIECARRLHQQAKQIVDTQLRSKALGFLGKFCQSQPGIHRVLALAQNVRPLSTTGEQWNRDPWLLGTSSGVIDLKSAELRRGERNDLVSLSLGVAYDPEAECPRWRRFVGEIFGGDENLAEYLQRALGYTLTGCTTEQTWFLCYGEGSNGKEHATQHDEPCARRIREVGAIQYV